MDIHVRRQSYMFTSPFSFYSNRGLKSTQEKQERQMQCDREVGFWEEKKENLKTMQCDTLEEIARKLELFHNYEEEISAVKSAYNKELFSYQAPGVKPNIPAGEGAGGGDLAGALPPDAGKAGRQQDRPDARAGGLPPIGAPRRRSGTAQRLVHPDVRRDTGGHLPLGIEVGQFL